MCLQAAVFKQIVWSFSLRLKWFGRELIRMKYVDILNDIWKGTGEELWRTICLGNLNYGLKIRIWLANFELWFSESGSCANWERSRRSWRVLSLTIKALNVIQTLHYQIPTNDNKVLKKSVHFNMSFIQTIKDMKINIKKRII